MDDSEKIKRLRELLLDEDRDAHQKLTKKVDSIHEQLNDHDQLIDTLYPIIGKAIKKFIRAEMQILTEKIEAQFAIAFSWKGWVRRFKGWFGGVKESQLMVMELANPQLEEMFVIENDSGILKASYSRNDTIDKDLIAGMLTAIKAFVEDAFSRGGASLEMIEYDSYNILLYEVKTFYVAVVCSGVLTATFKDKMQEGVFEFVDKYLKMQRQDATQTEEQFMTKQLKEYFDDSEI